MSCARFSCTLNSDCGDSENCQRAWLVAVIVVGVLCAVGIFICVVVRVYCSYKRRRSPEFVVVRAPPVATIRFTKQQLDDASSKQSKFVQNTTTMNNLWFQEYYKVRSYAQYNVKVNIMTPFEQRE